MWRLCRLYLFLISASFGGSVGLCCVIVAFRMYLYLYFDNRNCFVWSKHEMTCYFKFSQLLHYGVIYVAILDLVIYWLYIKICIL